jgi:hypothetical protein
MRLVFASDRNTDSNVRQLGIALVVWTLATAVLAGFYEQSGQSGGVPSEILEILLVFVGGSTLVLLLTYREVRRQSHGTGFGLVVRYISKTTRSEVDEIVAQLQFTLTRGELRREYIRHAENRRRSSETARFRTQIDIIRRHFDNQVTTNAN